MSIKQTRIANKNRKRSRNSRLFWKILWFIAFLWLLNAGIEAAGSTRTITIVNPSVQAQITEQVVGEAEAMADQSTDAPDASQDALPDPCGLEVVQCDGEEVKTPQNAKFEQIGDIEKMVRDAFPENPDVAVAIAKCESGLNPNRIGDGHLAFEHDGETLGRSVGIFQVRTGGMEGGKVWSRAAANGKTAKQFEAWMQNPAENIKYGRAIYERAGGWTPWTNCGKKIGVL